MEIICILLPMLLLGNCMCSTISDDCSSKATRTKITDLNIDVLFMITEDFLLEDLLSFATSHVRFITACGEQFWKIYKHRTIAIMKNDDSEQKLIQYEDCIEIYDIQTALNIWKCFGHKITNLKIQNYEIFNTSTDDVKEMFDIFGSTVLNHLNLDVIKEHSFEMFTVPFENVRELSFKVNGKINAIRFGPLSLVAMFPRLNRLNLELRKNVNYNFLAHTFPHLEHVFISISPSSWMRRNQIEQFFKQNKQIKSIRLDRFPADYIKQIKQLLPSIESLTLEEIDFKDRNPIQLNRVKHFKMYAICPGSIAKVSFPLLESIEMQYFEDYFDDWRDFFQKHNRITQLSVTQADGTNEMRLTELTAELNELKEIIIDCNTLMKGTSISKFINSHKKLIKFTLTFLQFGGTFEKDQNIFGKNKKWNFRFSRLPMKTIFLEKIESNGNGEDDAPINY